MPSGHGKVTVVLMDEHHGLKSVNCLIVSDKMSKHNPGWGGVDVPQTNDSEILANKGQWGIKTVRFGKNAARLHYITPLVRTRVFLVKSLC